MARTRFFSIPTVGNDHWRRGRRRRWRRWYRNDRRGCYSSSDDSSRSWDDC